MDGFFQYIFLFLVNYKNTFSLKNVKLLNKIIALI